jgi:hypothetical protein
MMVDDNMESDGALKNLKWELFAQEYVKPGKWFLNGGHAYSVVYGLNYEDEKDNNTCRVNASKLLTNTNIMDRIMMLLSEGGLNDATVANRLKEILLDNDKNASLKAMDIYYKYIKRFGEKIELSGEVSGITINVKNFSKGNKTDGE